MGRVGMWLGLGGARWGAEEQVGVGGRQNKVEWGISAPEQQQKIPIY